MFSRREIMNIYRSLMVLFVLLTLATIMMSGCKYDVAEPLWDTTGFDLPGNNPVIDSIDPPEGVPGVNAISIIGKNFHLVPDSNILLDIPKVQVISPEILEKTSTSITIRRPSLVTDSLFVKVWGDSGLVVKFGPYKIDPVLERNGALRDNIVLTALAVDNADNLYVVYGDSSTPRVFRVTSTNDKILVARASRLPTDARFGPDGRLYLMGNNRAIDVVDVEAQTTTQWIRLPSGRVVKCGDFGPNGYFYTGGTRSDLVLVAPDLTVGQAGYYASDEILAVRVYSGYVFVASRVPTSGGQPPTPASIWKHQIDGSGNVGPKELVLDMSGTAFASRTITAITFDVNGTMYVGTDSPDPILIANPMTGTVDYFYKSILPPYCKNFSWGRGTYLYMLSGNASPAQEWTVYRVDFGTAGAHNY
jgi:hypothetical protein